MSEHRTAKPQVRMSDDAKRRVGEEVAGWIANGMVVGLGTGSTAAYAIRRLGERVNGEHLQIQAVATSFFAERMARDAGIPLTTLDRVDGVDLAFDGADEVDPAFNLIKGRGAAHTREKVVADAASRFVVLVDDSKLVDRLGTRMPVPVEVIPMASGPVMRHLEALGAEVTLRTGSGKDGPVVSDQGLWILDARFDGIGDPEALAAEISSMPGVLDHGIFCGLTSDVLIGRADGSVDHRESDAAAL